MPIVTITNLEKTFGKRIIFEHLDFQIDLGERVGLIGANGAGKTTLFRLLTDEMTADSGSIAIARSIKVGHLSQNPTFDAANTVMDEAELAFARLHELSHQLREIEHEMAHQTGDELTKTLDAYQNVQHEFDLAGGYAWQHKLEATLLGVGLWCAAIPGKQMVKHASPAARSPGAAARQTLSSASPTYFCLGRANQPSRPRRHRMAPKIISLNSAAAVLLISHDRYLLDKLAIERIVWLTRQPAQQLSRQLHLVRCPERNRRTFPAARLRRAASRH